MAIKPRKYDDRRGSSAQRGYGYRWQKSRAEYLLTHPLCTYCTTENKVTAAAVVDHIQPHRGLAALFWDQSNWQPLCKACHDGRKQAEEHGTHRPGCDADGNPFGGWKKTP